MHRILAPLAFALLTSPALAQFPPGYVNEFVVNAPQHLVGITHDANGQMYMWGASGHVHVLIDDEPVLMLNIKEEVGRWGDHGMLGFALHPDFLENGYFYLHYVVDRHHLLTYGTPEYDPDTNWISSATIARLTRYTADASTGFTTVDPDSRHVIIGATIDTGVPIVSSSHGAGALLFAGDGSLLMGTGDGASYMFADGGQPGNSSYTNQALADGIIRPEEAVGSYRSQMIGSLNGKVLRLDVDTGFGLPDNPFFDPAAPASPASRVWSVGMRNPFRICIVPEEDEEGASHGGPGVLVVGDVGWNSWEEVHVIDGPGLNMGWPLYEGLRKQDEYFAQLIENRDAPNPLFDGTTCTQEFFYFKDLLMQEQEDHNPSFPNPCDSNVQIAPGTPTFMHTRPCLEWSHVADRSYVPIFENGTAKRSRLGSAGCPVLGDSFRGSSSTGGVFLSGLGFADPYKGQYFFGDWSWDWIRALRFDEDHKLTEVLEFGDQGAATSPTDFEEEPGTGDLYWVKWGYGTDGALFRVRYTGDTNSPPKAIAGPEAPSGSSPYLVQLDATSSFDPEGGELAFLWQFEDGTTSTEPSPWRTFDNPGGLPTSQEVVLLVTDTGGASASTQLHVSLDNTPPQVEITSPVNAGSYSTSSDTVINLDAQVFDAEHGSSELAYSWKVFLVHNAHEHLAEEHETETAQVTLGATSCGGESYGYHIELTVTDAAGLHSSAHVYLQPDCTSSGSVTITSPGPSDIIDPGDTVTVAASTTGSVSRVLFYVDGLGFLGVDNSPPFEASWTPTETGTHVLHAVALVDGEGSVTSPGQVVGVRQPTQVVSSVLRVRDDAQEDVVTGAINRGSGVIDLGLKTTLPALTGVRLPLDVPAGARILGATLQFSCAEREQGAAQLQIHAEASDSAGPILNSLGDLSKRRRTAASVQWRPESWYYPGATGHRERTPDLAPILQELIDRPGWQQGNHVLLLLEGFGQRRAKAFLNGGADRPTLTVEYSL